MRLSSIFEMLVRQFATSRESTELSGEAPNVERISAFYGPRSTAFKLERPKGPLAYF